MVAKAIALDDAQAGVKTLARALATAAETAVVTKLFRGEPVAIQARFSLSHITLTTNKILE